MFSSCPNTSKACTKPIAPCGVNDLGAQDSVEVTIIADVIFCEFEIQCFQQSALGQ